MNSKNYDNAAETIAVKQSVARRGLVTAAKAFVILGIVLNALIALSELIALLRLWTTDYFVLYGLIFDVCVAGIIFGVRALDQMTSGKPSNLSCAGVLVFTNMIGGILLLCTEREDYKKKGEEKNPVPRRRIVPAIRVHIIIGFVLNLFCGALAMSLIIYIGREYMFNDPSVSLFYPSLVNQLTFADYLFFICLVVWFIWCVAGIVSGILSLVKMADGKPSKFISVFAITNNIVTGMLLLCSKEADYQKAEAERQANAKGGLVTVAKAYISIGIVVEGLLINMLLVFFIFMQVFAGMSVFSGFFLTEEWVEFYMSSEVIADFMSRSIFGTVDSTYGTIISLICVYAAVTLALCGLGIAFGIKALNKADESEYSLPVAICVLLFTNLIGGILLICADNTEDSEIADYAKTDCKTENITEMQVPVEAEAE